MTELAVRNASRSVSMKTSGVAMILQTLTMITNSLAVVVGNILTDMSTL